MRKSGAPSRSLTAATKNNPVLNGETGCGQNQRSWKGFGQRNRQRLMCPRPCKNRQLISLDMGRALIAAARNTAVNSRAAQGRAQGGEPPAKADRACSSNEIPHPWWVLVPRGLEWTPQPDFKRCGPAVTALPSVLPTLDEHRQHIEEDPALERRFSRVFVDQPHGGRHDLESLRGLKER